MRDFCENIVSCAGELRLKSSYSPAFCGVFYSQKKENSMKKYLAIVGLVLCIAVPAFAGYDLSSKSFPNANYPDRPYSATVEDTGTDITAYDYIPIYRTDTGEAELLEANEIYGLGPAKAGSFTTGAFTGDVNGDGGDQLYGFRQDQVASTTAAVAVTQCQKTFVSNSADVMALPEASTALGCRFTFVCGTADDFDINPDDADIIGPVSTTNGSTAVVTLAPSAGDAIRCTDIGGSITLEAIAADRWAQVGGGNGIWTDVN